MTIKAFECGEYDGSNAVQDAQATAATEGRELTADEVEGWFAAGQCDPDEAYLNATSEAQQVEDLGLTAEQIAERGDAWRMALREYNEGYRAAARREIKGAVEPTQIVDVGPELGEVAEGEYEAECALLEQAYTVLEENTPYRVSVRPARHGEASGTYAVRANGDLQILGHSVEIPDDLQDLKNAAWDRYCATPRS